MDYYFLKQTYIVIIMDSSFPFPCLLFIQRSQYIRLCSSTAMPDGDNGLISNHIIEYIIGYKKQK